MRTSYLCYIEGSALRWQGVCVDFDLTVFGESVEDVKKKLTEVVGSYISAALTEAEPHRSRLLNRRSPWHTRAYWAVHVAATRIGHKLGAMAAATAIRLPAVPGAPCPA